MQANTTVNEERFEVYESALLAESNDTRSSLVIAVFLGLLTLGLYARSLGSGFVYDAGIQIASDDFIHTPSNLPDVISFGVMRRDVLDFNRPVHLMFLMFDSLLWGRNPLGFHLSSILFHSASTVLLFLVVFSWIEQHLREKKWDDPVPPARLGATASAIVFAWHPVNVESVAEVSFREDVLVTFFTLLALFLATRLKAGGKANRWIWIGIAWCSLYAVGSKESGVIVPVALLGYFLCFFGWKQRTIWLVPTIASFAICAVFIIARFVLEPTASAVFVTKPPRLPNFFSTQTRIFYVYLRALFWPVFLSVRYDGKYLELISLGAAISVLCIFIAIQVAWSILNRVVLLGTILFWGALLPASNIMPQYIPTAERYLNLPSAGVAIMVTMLLVSALPRRGMAIALATVLLTAGVCLAVLSFQRQAVFRSELSLWQEAVRANPNSPVAWDNLGWAQIDLGQMAEANRSLLNANALSPGNPDVLTGAAVMLNMTRDTTSADKWFAIAVSRDARFADPDLMVRTQQISKHQAEQMKPLAERFHRAAKPKPLF